MDYASLRHKLEKLRSDAEKLLEELSVVTDCSDAFITLENLVTNTENAIDYAENRLIDTRKTLYRFNDLVSPDSVKDDINSFKNTLLEHLQEKELRDDVAKPYMLFMLLTDDPDLDLPAEELDVIDAYFGKRISRLLYRGKFYVEQSETASNESERQLNDNGVTGGELYQDSAESAAGISETIQSEPPV